VQESAAVIYLYLLNQFKSSLMGKDQEENKSMMIEKFSFTDYLELPQGKY
jgi:hypothetical protein